MVDVREVLFAQLAGQVFTAQITSERGGILSGVERALSIAADLGITVNYSLQEGAKLSHGTPIMEIIGSPQQIVEAEDRLMGAMSKASGIASTAAEFVNAAGDSFQIICGAWKKMPYEIKDLCRHALTTGGVIPRMLNEPMVYLDKNYVAMLGGTENCITAVSRMNALKDRKIVIQIRGQWAPIDVEAWVCEHFGANIIFVDTGNINDLASIQKSFPYMKRIPKIAFAGNVTLDDIEKLKNYPIHFVDVGKALIDAPLLDMKMDVIGLPTESRNRHCLESGTYRTDG